MPSITKSRPRKQTDSTNDLPATRKMLFQVRDELKSDFRGLEYKFEGLEHKFEGMEHKFDAFTAEMRAIAKNMEAIAAQTKASVIRIEAIVEHQRADNKIVYEGLGLANQRLDRVESVLIKNKLM